MDFLVIALVDGRLNWLSNIGWSMSGPGINGLNFCAQIQGCLADTHYLNYWCEDEMSKTTACKILTAAHTVALSIKKPLYRRSCSYGDQGWYQTLFHWLRSQRHIIDRRPNICSFESRFCVKEDLRNGEGRWGSGKHGIMWKKHIPSPIRRAGRDMSA